jgi:hypothetical protein
MDFVGFTNRDRDCNVCNGYNRALITERQPAFPPLQCTATTAALFLSALVMRNPEVRSKNTACKQVPLSVVDEHVTW